VQFTDGTKGHTMIRKLTLRANGVALLAAVSITTVSPAQSGAAFLAAGTAALTPSPALALGKLKGKLVKSGDSGTVIRSVADGSVIVVPVDTNGEVRLTGLEPGDYEVASLRLTAAAPVRGTGLHVSEDGRLAFAMRKSVKHVEAVGMGRTQKSKPFLAPSAEAILFDGPAGIVPVDAVMLDLRQSFAVLQPPPCDPLPGRPDTCNRTPQRNHIDVNASSAAEIVRLAPTTSAEAAELIVAERTENGAYKGLGDFAQRVCTKARIDFDDVPVRFGEARVVTRRGGEPKSQGWKCAPGKDGSTSFEASLFWGPILIPFGLWI
jgi:hypothetical protein